MAGENGSIILAGQPVSYTIRYSKKAKHIRLEIRSETGLTVIIPRSYSSKGVPALIKKKERWILEKLEKYNNAQISRHNNTIKHGDAVLYLGRHFRVVEVQSSENTVSLSMATDMLIVNNKGGNRGLSAVIEDWYRKQALLLIEEKVKDFCARMGITYGKISIRGQKTRWGSCSKQGNLSFNWKLIMAPEPVIDYVIIHEIAHLTEMNHSNNFWRLVEYHCPEWRESRKRLKEYII